MNNVDGFHDWYLISMSVTSDLYDYCTKSKLILKFNSDVAFDLLLEFETPYIKYNFTSSNRIDLTTIIIDKYIYWINGEENIKVENIEKYNYIRGSKLRWKFILKDKNDW